MSSTPPPTSPPPSDFPSQPRRQRSRLAISIVIALVGAVVAAVAIGGYLLISQQQADERAEKRAAEKERKAEEAVQARADAMELCHAELDPFIEALSDIDAQLNVGMNQADYGSAVREASVKESRVNESDLSTECRSAFNAASDVLVGYAGIASEWNDCIYSDDFCDTDTDVDYSYWATAETEIEQIEEAVANGETMGRSGSGA